MAGPLHGLTGIELAGIGPGPHAAMLLADLGADIVRVERPGATRTPDASMRGRRVVALDLKDPADAARLLELVAAADFLLEGYRPGVLERLGLGPDVCLQHNPRLVVGRMTGWGQTGPRAAEAGHDINYLATTGALHAMGEQGRPPTPPLNLVADFGGGSMFLAFGILAALHERQTSGRGQVVDAAMVDGVSSLLQLVWSRRHSGQWADTRTSNIVDGGAPFYRTYACRGGGYFAVGAVEPQFYRNLLHGLGLHDEPVEAQDDRSRWPQLREVFADRFASQTRQHWTEVFDGAEACASPVLDFGQAIADDHLAARGTLIEVGGDVQAAPAPRFSRSVPADPQAPPAGVVDVPAVLAWWAADRAGG